MPRLAAPMTAADRNATFRTLNAKGRSAREAKLARAPTSANGAAQAKAIPA